MDGKMNEPAVAYLGPAATYTHLACIEYFGGSIRELPKESIQEIFETVEKKAANYGVVAIENSTEGSVSQTLDMFIESQVKICGEVFLRITHDLLSQTGRPENIEKIYSHPRSADNLRCGTVLGSNPMSRVAIASTERAFPPMMTNPTFLGFP